MTVRRRFRDEIAACSAASARPVLDDAGLPERWLAMVRSSLRTCGPKFGAGRMIEDYARQIYPPR